MTSKSFFLILVYALILAHPIQARKGEGKELRLLYWNIQNGMWDGQTDDYHRFTSWVKEQEPDICVWCEAQKLYVTGTATSEVETEEECLQRWKRLAKRYGHDYIYLSAHRDNYPQLLTSKFPLENMEKITGNKDTLVCHGASWFRLQKGKKALNLVTLHTWPMAYGLNVPKSQQAQSKKEHGGDKCRLAEMTYICKQTIHTRKKAKREYWAMMGDFNAVSRLDKVIYDYPDNSPAYWVHDYILEETPYKDVIKEFYPDTVISTTGKTKRIDFVYATPKLLKKVKHAAIIREGYPAPVRNAQNISNFWHPSDHSPILVDFRF